MPEASIHALVCDLLGGDPEAAHSVRPTVAAAARTCPRGALVAARAGERDVAVAVLDDGRTFVMPDVCPHDGGLLSDGYVEGESIVCARHHWEFEAATGSCPYRPDIHLDIHALRRRKPER